MLTMKRKLDSEVWKILYGEKELLKCIFHVNKLEMGFTVQRVVHCGGGFPQLSYFFIRQEIL